MNSKKTLTFSVIIPAHNEEKYIARCIRSVRRAVKESGRDAEIIVVCNRCTDRTEQIAQSLGAVTLRDETRCIAAVRNAGIRAAKGRYIVTIDSDNRMTKGTLAEIYRLMQTGRYIGGGAPIRFERYSVPLYLNDLLCRAGFALTGLYSGIFWAERKTFLSIGGFADKRAMEDVYTAKALKRYGKARGKAYTCLKENVLINSVRKYDDLGDWLYFRLIAQNFGALVRAAFGDRSGTDRLIDELFTIITDDTGISRLYCNKEVTAWQNMFWNSARSILRRVSGAGTKPQMMHSDGVLSTMTSSRFLPNLSDS